MKGVRILFLLVTVTLFLGSGGYLLYDYVTSQKAGHDIEKLAEIVERSSDMPETSPDTRQGRTVQVRLATRVPPDQSIGQETFNPSGQEATKPEKQEPGEKIVEESTRGHAETDVKRESEAYVPAATPNPNDAAGSVEAVQDTLEKGVEESERNQAETEETREGETFVSAVTLVPNDAVGSVETVQGHLHEDPEKTESSQAETDENREGETSLPAAVTPVSNDAVGLAEAVQDYLQLKITSVNQSIDTIRLEITPKTADESDEDQNSVDGQEQKQVASVRARIYGRVGSTATKQTMEEEIEHIVEQCIAHDESWTVQTEMIDLDVNIEPAPILSQYEEVYHLNTDMIGWIKIDGTQVNYPVMQTLEDPEFYLRRDFEKENSYSGLPFMDSRCDVSEPTHNLLIYGHNMKSGTMFGQLPNYESKSFWEKHRVIKFDLLNETRTYEVVGMFRSKQYKEGEEGFRYYEYIDLSELGRFNEYIAQVKNASFIDTGITANWGDQLITLSTCSYHDDAGMFVVVAKRQR